METLTRIGMLVVEECPTCGTPHGFTRAIYDQGLAKKRGRSIYCPNGHSWSYLGKTHEEELAELRDRVARERAIRDQAEASERAQRAAATRARNERDRLKKRASAGVCPCCNRTFQQLARHMKAKHPEHGLV